MTPNKSTQIFQTSLNPLPVLEQKYLKCVFKNPGHWVLEDVFNHEIVKTYPESEMDDKDERSADDLLIREERA